VNRLGQAGMSLLAIASELSISLRQVRRLAERRPLGALRRDLQTISSHRQALLEARRLVDKLRARLEDECSAIIASRLRRPASAGSGEADGSIRRRRSRRIRSSTLHRTSAAPFDEPA
jgi:hypothetical protein